MADTLSANVHVGAEADLDHVRNIVLATQRLCDQWREENPNRRFGINFGAVGHDGVLKIEFVGWQNG